MATAFQNQDGSEAHGLIDYERAEVVPGIVNGTFFLVVHGTKPCINMTVELAPLIYVKCPEYWGIQLIGKVPGGICLTTVCPFTVSIPLSGVTGKKGVELLAASKKERFAVSGGCS